MEKKSNHRHTHLHTHKHTHARTIRSKPVNIQINQHKFALDSFCSNNFVPLLNHLFDEGTHENEKKKRKFEATPL